MARQVIHADVSLDFKVLAVVCSLKDYRFCWLLNHAVDVNLTRQPEHEVTEPITNRKRVFSRFSHRDDIRKTIIHVLSNSSRSDHLVAELRGMDYLVMFKGYWPDEEVNLMQEIIRGMQGIEAVFAIDPKSLRSAHNLILDDEEF